MNIAILAYVSKYGTTWEWEYSKNNPIKTMNDMQREWAKMADQGKEEIYLTRYQLRDYFTLLRNNNGTYYQKRADKDITPYYSGIPIKVTK